MNNTGTDTPFNQDTPSIPSIPQYLAPTQNSLGTLPLSADALLQAENATDILPDLQNDLVSGESQDYIDTLPSAIQRRISALKKLQFNYNELEAEFLLEVSRLEVKYQEKFQPLLTKRSAIISGTVEPKDDEVWCDHESPPEAERVTRHPTTILNSNDAMEQDISDQLTTKVKLDSPVKLDRGIPDFWLTAFQNVDIVAEQIQEWDIPLLRDIEDVRVIFPDNDGLNFKLEFYFRDNLYITDHVLTKWYTVKCEVDSNNPFEFSGPEIINCIGCEIHWKKGQNITKKIKKKKQKSKGRGQNKTITKTVTQESFFHFFSPPSVPEDISLLEDAQSTAIELDFSIAETFKERVIPRAVLYFTGEILMSGETSCDDTSDSSSQSDEEIRGNSKHTRFKCDSDSEQGQENKAPTQEKPPECDKQVQ